MRIIKKHYNILLLSLFFIPISCATFNKKAEQSKAITLHGEKLLAQNKLDEALSEFNKALGITPDYARASYGLASVYKKKGMLDKALIKYEEAQKQFPFNILIMADLGRAYHEKGELDKAITIYNLALFNLKEEDIKTGILLDLGKLYFKKKRYKVALVQFKKVIKMEPLSSSAYYYIGKIYLEYGKTDAAIKEFERAVALLYLEDDKKYFASLYKAYAEALEKNGQNKKAKEMLSRSEKLNSSN